MLHLAALRNWHQVLIVPSFAPLAKPQPAPKVLLQPKLPKRFYRQLLSSHFEKSTPVKTITPSISTSTVLVTVTATSTSTALAIADVFSTTSTAYETLQTTVSITSQVIVGETTTITVPATTNVATPLGFVPIQATSTVVKAKRVPENHSSNNAKQQSTTPKKASANCFKSQPYAAAVTCAAIQQIRYTQVVIEIEPTSTTTLLPITTTVSSTTTSTSTLTVLAAKISTTLSFSTTVSVTLTIQTTIAVTTSSDTYVTATSTTTSYDACATSNILGPTVIGGYHLYDNYFTDTSASVLSPTANSAYACCVACVTTTNCQYSAYATSYGICNIIVGTTCPAGQPLDGYFYKTVGANEFEATYSNGLCGSVADGGAD